jgi:hypothetical protein
VSLKWVIRAPAFYPSAIKLKSVRKIKGRIIRKSASKRFREARLADKDGARFNLRLITEKHHVGSIALAFVASRVNPAQADDLLNIGGRRSLNVERGKATVDSFIFCVALSSRVLLSPTCGEISDLIALKD